jgi:hypothetical protein
MTENSRDPRAATDRLRRQHAASEIRAGEARVAEGALRRMVLRLGVAVVVTLLAGLLAAGFWAVGQAQYLNDYCSTQAPRPKAPTPEALDGRPAYLDSPMTVRCEYHNLPTVVVIEPLPLAGALVLGALVVGIAFVTFRWARSALLTP